MRRIISLLLIIALLSSATITSAREQTEDFSIGKYTYRIHTNPAQEPAYGNLPSAGYPTNVEVWPQTYGYRGWGLIVVEFDDGRVIRDVWLSPEGSYLLVSGHMQDPDARPKIWVGLP